MDFKVKTQISNNAVMHEQFASSRVT